MRLKLNLSNSREMKSRKIKREYGTAMFLYMHFFYSLCISHAFKDDAFLTSFCRNITNGDTKL